MSILSQLASQLSRRDEVPNQELAAKIISKSDKAAVAELVEQLQHKTKDIRFDCIKVLYEIGKEQPALIAPYFKDFVVLLSHKDNRLQWGGMTALYTLVPVLPDKLYKALPEIMASADKGSVITKDNAVSILAELGKNKSYKTQVFPLLMEQLKTCPINQLGMYAEKTLELVDESNKALFIKAVRSRFPDIEKDSQQKRLDKILKKLV